MLRVVGVRGGRVRGSIRAALTAACLVWGCGSGEAQRPEEARELTRGTSAMYATQEDMPRGALGRYGSRAMRLFELSLIHI